MHIFGGRVVEGIVTVGVYGVVGVGTRGVLPPVPLPPAAVVCDAAANCFAYCAAEDPAGAMICTFFVPRNASSSMGPAPEW